MDYYHHLIKILKRNNITTMPDIELINSSPDIALALWGSFNIYKDYYDSPCPPLTWYIKCEWGKNLKAYKEDIGFWEKIFSTNIRPLNYKHDILLSKEFNIDYPIIAAHYLDNETSLIKLFQESLNLDFFNLIKNKNESHEKYFVEYLAKSYKNITQENINKYESNHSYVIELLKSKPDIYKLLNNENQRNDEFISYAIKNKEMFNFIPDNKKDNILPSYLQQHHNNISMKEFHNIGFTESQKIRILQSERMLLEYMIKNKDYRSKYINIIKTILESDFDNNLRIFPLDVIVNMYKSPQCFENIKVFLKQHITLMKDIADFTEFQKRIIALIHLDEDLLKELKLKPEYQFSEKCFNNKNVSKIDFYEFADYVDEKCIVGEMEQGGAEKLLTSVKKRLDPKVQQEEKIPHKDILRFLRLRKLEKKMQNQLSINEVTYNKVKI